MHLLIIALLSQVPPVDEPFKYTNLHVEQLREGEPAPFGGTLVAAQDSTLYAQRLTECEAGQPRIVAPAPPDGGGAGSFALGAALGAVLGAGGAAAATRRKKPGE